MAKKKIELQHQSGRQLSSKEYKLLRKHPDMKLGYVDRYKRLCAMYDEGVRLIGMRDLRDHVFGTRAYTTLQLQGELVGMAAAGLIEYGREGLEIVRITLKDVETKIAERLSFITPAHKTPEVIESFIAYFNREHFGVTGYDMRYLADTRKLASKVIEQCGGLKHATDFIDQFFGTPAERLPGYSFRDFYNYLPEMMKSKAMWKQIERDMKAYDRSLEKRRQLPPKMTPEEVDAAVEAVMSRYKKVETKPLPEGRTRADD